MTPQHQMAFEKVNATLVADPVLACPDFIRTFILQTDTSGYGIGAILTQDTNRYENEISYSSRTLNGTEKNYSTTEKKCLAIAWVIRKLNPYLEGYHFEVVTDHMAPKWLNNIECPSGRIVSLLTFSSRVCLAPPVPRVSLSYRLLGSSGSQPWVRNAGV